MDLGAAGLNRQPFRTHGPPPAVVSYASHRDGLKVLAGVHNLPHGLALLQGPRLSGKSVLVNHFIASLSDDCEAAVVDGRGLGATELIGAMLGQLGYELDQVSENELCAILRVFVLQQAEAHEPPMLFIDNAHALNPSALAALCDLAELEVRERSAVKLVLISDRSLKRIVNAPAMRRVAERLTHDFHLRPMTRTELSDYMHSKLSLAGCAAPESIMPGDLCGELWDVSGGWPGVADRLALLALAKAKTLPISLADIERPALPRATWEQGAEAPECAAKIEPCKTELLRRPPLLYVSRDGESLNEITFTGPRILIGRSDYNDIAIRSRFISRHHVLLIRHGARTYLMDLNSSNGTFVNSRRVSNHVLRHNDVIALGTHRIKFDDPAAIRSGSLDGAEFTETIFMKSIDDMRRLLAREQTRLVENAGKKLPTAG